MAYYLLAARPEKVVAQLGRLRDFDYRGVPPLYAEAAAFCAHNMDRPPVANGRPLPAQAVRQIERIVQIAGHAGGDRRKLAAALAAEFPASAARYFLTGQSGTAE